jgi:DNA-binding CsgD family transcriptional regulator
MLMAAAWEIPTSWAPDSAVIQIPVRPLEADAVGALLTDILGGAEPSLVGACVEVTGGNPLLVRELARALKAAGHGADVSQSVVHQMVPETIVVSTHARVASFGRDAVAMAEALALLGDGHDLAQVAELASLDSSVAAAAVDRLTTNGFLRQGRPLAFEHPLLLAAVRDSMPESRRSDLHLQAMRLFGAVPGGLDRASAHALLTDPSGSTEVVSVLREGARRAVERAAPHAAVTYLRRALAEPPIPEDETRVILDLATAAYAAQDPDALDLAQLAFEKSSNTEEAISSALLAGHLLTMSGRGRDAAGLLLEIMEADGVAPEVRDAAFEAAVIGSASSIDAREPVRPLLARASEQANDAESPLSLRAVAAVELAVATGTAKETIDMAQRAWAEGELLAQTGSDQPFVHSAALSVAIAGDLELLDAWGTSLTEAAAQAGSLLGRLISVVWPAWSREAQGDLTASEAYARECIELSARAGIPIATSVPVVVLSRALLPRTGPEAAAKALELVPAFARNSDLITTPMYWLARAAANCELGRYQEALADVRDIQRWQRRWPAPSGGWTFWEPFAVEAHLAQGNPDEAREVAVDGLHRARAFGARRPVVHALQALALTSAPEERDSLLTEAIELTGLGGCGADEATLLLLRSAGRDAEHATDDLQRSLAVCDRTGAAHIASKAVGALTTLGARPRRAAVSGVHSLTPAERRVVDLAASGRTNRAIAEVLFITEKTTESHLTNAYRKLGVHSRAQLAGFIDASHEESGAS